MDVDGVVESWQSRGFVVLPGYLPSDQVGAAVQELPLLFPSAEDFHDAVDPDRNARFLGDEFDGIDGFPFASLALNRLAVCDALCDLAATLLGNDDLRLYSAEAWAKYQGAADYEQELHRDYLNHTVLVPAEAPEFQQVEFFVFLSDVTAELGAPRLVPRSELVDVLPAKPNFFPRTGSGGESGGGFVATEGRPDLYAREVAATGGPGTVVAFQTGTLHRGAAIARRRGARFTMHINYRPASVEWGQRYGWADRSHHPHWYEFVGQATAEQLALFGFPPPGHPYWTSHTITGVGQRYPGLDMSPWRAAL